MQKLTLTAEPSVIKLAKRLAKTRGTSVSRLFSDFVKSAGRARPKDPSLQDLSPLTRRAIGIVELPKNMSDRELIEEALAEKYGL